MEKSKRFTPKEAATATNWPLNSWPGNCYGIACAIVKAGLVPGGVAVYGHWIGPVHEESMFFRSHSAIAIVRHGWIRMPDGTIIDPTRFTFEHVEPYIYEGSPTLTACADFEASEDDEEQCESCGCFEDEHANGFFRPCRNCLNPYDEGGNSLREALMMPYPKEQKGNIVEMDWNDDLAITVVTTLTGREPHDHRVWSMQQLMWVANLSPRQLGAACEPIFRAIDAAGHSILIPMDNYDMVLGKTRRKTA